MCLDHPAALPWPYNSSIDYCLYFFTQQHNASKRPNCPWRAKIIVYNRPSTCNHKSATVCFLGRRQEPALCAQVIFFPGVSGQGLPFLNACVSDVAQGNGIVLGDSPMSIWRGATLVSPLEEQWNTLQRCCIWSMFTSALRQWGKRCYTTQEMVFFSEREELDLADIPDIHW